MNIIEIYEAGGGNTVLNNPTWRPSRAERYKKLASLNDMKVSNAGFSLNILRDGKKHGRWERYETPLLDHIVYFKRNGWPVAILAQPYGATVDEILQLSAKHGLIAQSPPRPRASIYYPGGTLCLMITRRGFGPVSWLPEQVA